MSPVPDSSTPPQKREFVATEGDQWFARNVMAIAAQSPLREMMTSRIAAQLTPGQPARVLEIGCGQGANLAAIASHHPAVEAHGIEPSGQAVSAGRQQYPSLNLRTGTADELPYNDASFDVVWFGFCLYLVDRTLLMRAVAEADRVLCDGGILAIIDFDPTAPCRRPYHHRPGLYSYKMDHSQLFLANPAYVMIEKQSTSHTTGRWEHDPQERVALTICRKDLEHAYQPL